MLLGQIADQIKAKGTATCALFKNGRFVLWGCTFPCHICALANDLSCVELSYRIEIFGAFPQDCVWDRSQVQCRRNSGDLGHKPKALQLGADAMNFRRSENW